MPHDEILSMDGGLACLLLIAGVHGIPGDENRLRHEFGSMPLSLAELLLAARSLGLAARKVRQSALRWAHVPLPAMARDTEADYCVIADTMLPRAAVF